MGTTIVFSSVCSRLKTHSEYLNTEWIVRFERKIELQQKEKKKIEAPKWLHLMIYPLLRTLIALDDFTFCTPLSFVIINNNNNENTTSLHLSFAIVFVNETNFDKFPIDRSLSCHFAYGTTKHMHNIWFRTSLNQLTFIDIHTSYDREALILFPFAAKFVYTTTCILILGARLVRVYILSSAIWIFLVFPGLTYKVTHTRSNISHCCDIIDMSIPCVINESLSILLDSM